jgi:hypothetical protein
MVFTHWEVVNQGIWKLQTFYYNASSFLSPSLFLALHGFLKHVKVCYLSTAASNQTSLSNRDSEKDTVSDL